MPQTAVILMTAYSTADVIQGALDLGAVRVFRKPFKMNDMAALVKRAC
jgi:DNA-binding NtrC family response regulator